MKRIALLVVAGICMLSLAAYAGHGHKHGHKHGCKHGKHGKHGMHSPAMMKEALSKAGLSDQQIRRIETLHDGIKKKNLDLRHQLEKIHLEMETLMKNYQVDKSAAFGLLEKAHALKLQKKKNWIEFKLDMRKEMTPDQWEKVRELHASMKGKHGKHCGCGGKGHLHHK